MEILEAYCLQYAVTYDNFDNEWIYLRDIENNTPFKFNNSEGFLKYRNSIEKKDTDFHYLLSIRDYRLKGEPMPLSMVEDEIKAIILNKRKLRFNKELENNIFEDAENRGLFEIY
jgi:hypothetical protein